MYIKHLVSTVSQGYYQEKTLKENTQIITTIEPSTKTLNHTIKLHQTCPCSSLFVRPRHPSKATIMDHICFSAGGLAGVILGIMFGTIVLCLIVFMGMATSILFNWG
jgi:hypothetical protein